MVTATVTDTIRNPFKGVTPLERMTIIFVLFVALVILFWGDIFGTPKIEP